MYFRICYKILLNFHLLIYIFTKNKPHLHVFISQLNRLCYNVFER